MDGLSGRRVFVAGHAGLVGSALVRALHAAGAKVLTAPRPRLDLRDAGAVGGWMRDHRPEVVLLAAARVGGIGANQAEPVEFLRDNLLIQTSVMESARLAGVERLVFLSSSCAYPREAPQPMAEEVLLCGPPEPTNAPYAVAKAAGMLLARAMREQHGLQFRSVVACNTYDLSPAADVERAHVIPALLHRMAEAAARGAPEVPVWGTGRARREFLHVDDLARAVLDVAARPPEEDWINVGSGEEVTIAELAELIAEVTGFRGRIRFDASRPDGAPRKVLDSSRMRARGWRPRVGLWKGLMLARAALTLTTEGARAA